MTATLERSEADAPDPGDPRRRRLRRVGGVTLGIWLVALVVWSWRYGIPVDRTVVFAWIAAGLLAASIGRRSAWTVLVDWLPFALVLAAYDFARHVAVTLRGIAVWTPQLDVDRFLFGGATPTVWLQDHLKLGHPPWWEVPVSLCYASFFLLPYAVAGVLWLRSRREFRRWAVRFVLVSLLGVGFFALLPTAPPWAAALCTPQDVSALPVDPGCMHAPPSSSLRVGGGLLGPVHPLHPGAAPYVERLSGRGWSVLHLQMAETALYKGQEIANLVAAVPSLHEATALLVTFFFWRRVRRPLRPLLLLYPALMAFTLVYTGEHYVTDLLAALVLVAVVQGGVGAFERRRQRRRPDTLEPTPQQPTPQQPTPQQPTQEQVCPPTATTPSST